MSWTKPTYAECHPDRPYFAAGLCRTCYNKETYRCRRRATCHPERPRCSRDGLCGPCYQHRNGPSPCAARVKPTPAVEPPRCHPDRPYCAGGLCRTCYQRQYQRRRSAEQRRQVAAGLVPGATCHPDRPPATSAGLCQSCYQTQRKYAQRHRAKHSGAPVNDLTPTQWAAIVEHHGGACAYCRATDRPLEMDHAVPISRGGRHTHDNVVPACRPCNRRKRDKTPEEFRAWLKGE